MSAAALLIGIFGVPIAALWLGQHFRNRTPRQRAIFWGLVLGYGVGVLVVSGVLMLRPVLWTDAQPIRTGLVYWGLVGISGLGALIGLIRPVPAAD